MNIVKTVKLLGTILSFEIDKAKLLNYIGETFDRGIQERVAMELNKLDMNNNGKLNVIDLLLFLLEKIK